MAKKRKNKFSKTKQRPKSRVRSEVDKMKIKIGGGNTLTPTMARTYLNNLSDAANATNIAAGTITSYPSLSSGAAALFFNKSDAGASKRVMHINLTQTTPKGDTKMNDALRAAIENDGNPPAEIAVSAKNGDEAAVKSQLEQMVADMNEEARGDATKQQYRVEQDGDAVPTPNGKRLNVTFKLTPIAADAPPVLSPVMSSAELREGLGKDAKLTGSRQYTDMLAALDAYHLHLQSLAPHTETTTTNNLKDNLLNAANAYLQKHPKSKGGKKNAAERLIEQLNAANEPSQAEQRAIKNWRALKERQDIVYCDTPMTEEQAREILILLEKGLTNQITSNLKTNGAHHTFNEGHREQEWGILKSRTSADEVVIVNGEDTGVSWPAELRQCGIPLSHSHPFFGDTGKKARNRHDQVRTDTKGIADHDGNEGVISWMTLQRNKGSDAQREVQKIFPSASDIEWSGKWGVPEHTVYTPYAVIQNQQGETFIANPDIGMKGIKNAPRLEFRIVNARLAEDGQNYKCTMLGKTSNGLEIWNKEVTTDGLGQFGNLRWDT